MSLDLAVSADALGADFEWTWSVLTEEHRPDAAVTVSEWADKHRHLSTKASAEPGLWRTARTPYLRAIMDDLSSYSPVETVVVKKGAQVGLSECGLNFVGYVIHHAPGPALYVMPTVEMAQKISKTRLQPMISASPSLLERIPPVKSTKDASNALLSKDFPGGVLMLTGANSASGLRSMPIRYLVLDEVDGYPASADDDGDPVNLAIKRTANFVRRKIFMLSTPGVSGRSRISKAFADGDQRYFHVACEGCGTLQPITWPQIRWPKGEPDKAKFVCREVDHCNTGPASETHPNGGPHEHAEHAKERLMAAGAWAATAEAKRPGLRSYHVSSLYSPWQTWADLAQQFLECHGPDGRADPSQLQVFVNTVLGEEWNEGGETVSADGLLALREDWGPVVPSAVAVLTAGIDVQNDRLEVEVVGWGKDEESWSIETRVFVGDPSEVAVWDTLDEFLKRRWDHAGYPQGLSIQAGCIDTGGSHTARVYAWAHPRSSRKIWAIKGSKEYRAPVWPKRPSRTRKSGTNFYMVGVSAAKDIIYKRLARVGAEHTGAGSCHFGGDWDQERFEQLTAEIKRIKYLNGFAVPYWWKPDGARNEALDCRVYAYAALQSLVQMGLKLNAQALIVAQKVAKIAKEGAIPAVAVQIEPVSPPEMPNSAEPAPEKPKPPDRPAPQRRRKRPRVSLPAFN
jgi:phage terminase large subunit GpA-like protein